MGRWVERKRFELVRTAYQKRYHYQVPLPSILLTFLPHVDDSRHTTTVAHSYLPTEGLCSSASARRIDDEHLKRLQQARKVLGG